MPCSTTSRFHEVCPNLRIQASERRKRLYLMPLKEGFYVSNEPPGL